MSSNEIPQINSAHFIGIGGVGMSGIALVAHERGMTVSGSDLKESRISRALSQHGIRVDIGHDAANLGDPYVVVVSSAIAASNPELRAAKARGIEIWPRARMLAFLGQSMQTIAVAGTHGKTTTSSMVATSLARLGADPTFLIGGVVDGYGTNAVSGSGQYYVVEADESDGSFTFLSPYIAMVTNIEEDHLDHYANLTEIEDAFVDFMSRTPQDGLIVIEGDDPRLPALAARTGRRVITYGFSSDCDVRCVLDPGVSPGSAFTVILPDGSEGRLGLSSNPGAHNALNATAVMGVLWFLGFDVSRAAEALSRFSGVRRRFDRVGCEKGIQVVDDYGHHPTEVKATIAAAKGLGYKHVHVLFQPHRYSRTEALAKQWGSAFDQADTVTFMDVYSAGEAPIPGISGKTLVDSVLSHNPRALVAWMPHREEVTHYLATRLKSGDLLLTMGAGDVTNMGPLLLKELAEHKEA